MHTKKFGHARKPQQPDAVVGRRMIAPRQLPEKGIFYHPNHLRRMWKKGLFPEPCYLSPRKFAWPEEVIDAWLASKVEGER
jgi:hypothetical protein